MNQIHNCERHWALKKKKIEANSLLEIGDKKVHLCNECAHQFLENMKQLGQTMETKTISPKKAWSTLMTLEQSKQLEVEKKETP